ncbi:MAG: hypothetical protein Q4D74_10160, partial [Comamonadaceae bacterium]|nr:hypothetical protein [Comamonadaceae bacterium]
MNNFDAAASLARRQAIKSVVFRTARLRLPHGELPECKNSQVETRYTAPSAIFLVAFKAYVSFLKAKKDTEELPARRSCFRLCSAFPTGCLRAGAARSCRPVLAVCFRTFDCR